MYSVCIRGSRFIPNLQILRNSQNCICVYKDQFTFYDFRTKLKLQFLVTHHKTCSKATCRSLICENLLLLMYSTVQYNVIYRERNEKQLQQKALETPATASPSNSSSHSTSIPDPSRLPGKSILKKQTAGNNRYTVVGFPWGRNLQLVSRILKTMFSEGKIFLATRRMQCWWILASIPS